MEKILKANKLSRLCIHFIFILLTLFFIIPFLMIISISFTNERSIVDFGYQLIPKQLSTLAYEFIFKNPDDILTGYKVTSTVSFVGTFFNILIGSMCAYALSRRDFKYRKAITFYLFFTMLFSGGLVPYYILMTKYLHLQNTLQALILPLLVNVWYIFIMRTFFQELPISISESAIIDGANDFQIYTRFIIPLSKPVLASIGLFVLLDYWNDWFQALLFISKSELIPLQFLLQRLVSYILQIMQSMNNMPKNFVQVNDLPTESVRMAMVVIAAGPMLIVFPFFQKYFVRGLTIGSVKG